MFEYEFDLESQPEFVQQAAGYALQVWDLAGTWLLSPPAWMQFALLIAAYILAVLVARRLRPALTRLLTPPAEQSNVFAIARRFVLIFVPLVLPLLAYMFTGIGETVVRSLFDSDIDTVPTIIEAAVARPSFVLDDPDGPDCELRGVGDRDIAVEFWVNGVNDGRNKFTPKVLFAVWSALRGSGIEIPYPHRMVALKGGPLGIVA